MAVEIVSDLEERIRQWTTNHSTKALPEEYIWELIDEVIDDVSDVYDPYYTLGFGTATRSSTEHRINDPRTPTPKVAGVIVNSAQVEAGAVPDNTEYLQMVLFPSGLRRRLDVYYGGLGDGNKLGEIGYDEFRRRQSEDGGGFESGVVGGTPTHYAEYGEAFMLHPAPPFALTITSYGTYRAERISSGGDTNLWITEAPNLLRYGVMEKLLDYNFAEDDMAAVASISRKFKSARTSLLRRTRGSSGKSERSKMRKYGTRRT